MIARRRWTTAAAKAATPLVVAQAAGATAWALPPAVKVPPAAPPSTETRSQVEARGVEPAAPPTRQNAPEGPRGGSRSDERDVVYDLMAAGFRLRRGAWVREGGGRRG